MKINELLIKADDGFKDKVAFKCSDCEKDGEYMDPSHPEWYDFCRAQNRNPHELQFAFRKACEDECKGTLQLYEKTSFNSFNISKPQAPSSYNFNWEGN